MSNIEVKMITQTPLCTGDAFSESHNLKPQSLLGSLRFWLEVICYAAGELDINCKNEVKQSTFFSKVNEILERQEISLPEAKKEALKELAISIPSQLFGCNGWEGFVRIKEIDFCNKQIELPCVIYKEKEKQDGWKEEYPVIKNGIKKCPGNIDKEKEHAWYFPDPCLFGEAKIKLELTDKKVGQDIIFPLLNFIQKYGFVGGKNNLGFGRVKFDLENTNLSEFNQFRFYNKTVKIDDIIKEKKFDDLINYDLVKEGKIGFCNFGPYKFQKGRSLKEKYLQIIKTLLAKKSKLRGECKGDNKKYNKKSIILHSEKRHFVFGSTVRDKYKKIEGPNATKLIPWINHVENDEYEYGFISLILLEKFPRG